MEKEELKKYLLQGLSTREIEKITGLNHRTISYWVKKYNLNDLSNFKKTPNYSFYSIDTPEKAYTLGFILADGAISNDRCEVSVAIRDREVVDFIANIVGATVREDLTYDKKNRRFPRVRLAKKINDIKRFIGGETKKNRHYPRVQKDMRRYLMQGFFDGDGCITWGYRKDRGRIWHKVMMKSSLSILTGLQNELLNELDISSAIRPVKDEDAYVIEFCNKTDVLKFLNYIYPDDNYIVLQRKYQNQRALRLELGENGESCECGQCRAKPAEQEGVETNGDMATYLNNRASAQAH